MSVKALEELREYVNTNWTCQAASWARLNEAVDNIEAEIAERFIELPCDMDGVRVEIGDRLHEHEDGHEFTVDGLKTWGNDRAWWAYQENGVQAPVRRCTHVKPRTLEEVLLDIVMLPQMLVKVRVEDVKPYADEIRELIGGSE